MFAWMAVQFHCFISSFFPPEKGRWLPFAYASLAVMVILLSIGFLTNDITVRETSFTLNTATEYL